MASLSLENDYSLSESTTNSQEPFKENRHNDEGSENQNQQPNDDITEEELRITLISSVEEKLKVKLEEEVSKTQAEIQCLHDTNRELLDRQEDICKIGKQLEENINNLSQYTNDLTGCDKEMQQAVDDIEQNLKVSFFFYCKIAIPFLKILITFLQHKLPSIIHNEYIFSRFQNLMSTKMIL